MNAKLNTIDVEFETASAYTPADPAALETLVRDTCKEAGLSSAVVSIRVVDDEQMIAAHQCYFGKESTTDVISFDLSDEFEARRSFALIVNAAMAQRQAKRRKHSMEAELALYITHGLLHNLGYDDCDKNESRRMHEMEDAILQRHGFGKVYSGQ